MTCVNLLNPRTKLVATWRDPTVTQASVWAIEWRAIHHHDRAALGATLTQEEQDRATRFRQIDDSDRFRIGRGLLRTLSAQHFGVPANSLQICLAPRGKPYLHAPPSPLGINLSHAGDWIYIILGPSAEVGIDIQEHRRQIDMPGIADIAMHPAERAKLSTLSDSETREAFFFDVWALREAALKATGDGFFAQKECVNTLPVPEHLVWTRRAFGTHQYVDLMRLPAAAGHACAIGIEVNADAAKAPTPIFKSQKDLLLG